MSSFVCAWCRAEGATRKVKLDSDPSVESYRYFCNAQHQANWETNQPRPGKAKVLMDTASFFEILKEANLKNWWLLNCFQVGYDQNMFFRVNLFTRNLSGATPSIANEFAEHTDPRIALLSAYNSAMARVPVDEPKTIRQNVERASKLTTAQEKRLEKAVDALFFAVKMDNGTRSRNRTSDL